MIYTIFEKWTFYNRYTCCFLLFKEYSYKTNIFNNLDDEAEIIMPGKTANDTSS